MAHPYDREHLEFPRLWQTIAWLLVVAVVIVTLMPKPPQVEFMPSWDKAHHFLAYAGLTFWFRQAFVSIRWTIFLMALGIALEFIQGWSGYRYFEYGDMLANTLGVIGGLLLASTPLGRLIRWLDYTLGVWMRRWVRS